MLHTQSGRTASDNAIINPDARRAQFARYECEDEHRHRVPASGNGILSWPAFLRGRGCPALGRSAFSLWAIPVQSETVERNQLLDSGLERFDELARYCLRR